MSMYTHTRARTHARTDIHVFIYLARVAAPFEPKAQFQMLAWVLWSPGPAECEFTFSTDFYTRSISISLKGQP